jgi:hypothetical protein
MLERGPGNLMSRAADLDVHETAVEAEHECLRKTRADLLNREHTISF